MEQRPSNSWTTFNLSTLHITFHSHRQGSLTNSSTSFFGFRVKPVLTLLTWLERQLIIRCSGSLESLRVWRTNMVIVGLGPSDHMALWHTASPLHPVSVILVKHCNFCTLITSIMTKDGKNDFLTILRLPFLALWRLQETAPCHRWLCVHRHFGNTNILDICH